MKREVRLCDCRRCVCYTRPPTGAVICKPCMRGQHTAMLSPFPSAIAREQCRKVWTRRWQRKRRQYDALSGAPATAGELPQGDAMIAAMQTQINGKDAPWPPDLYDAWNRVMDGQDDDRPVVRCNYFTPRPYQDDYDRGSDKWGFTYTRSSGWPADPAVFQVSFTTLPPVAAEYRRK
jgi:hypothetical protein